MAKQSKWENYIDELLTQPNFMPQDLIIDDRDIPQAKNVIDFFYNPQFLQNCVPTGLFPKQAEILINLMGDYCPNCSDMDWFRNNIEVDTPVDTILEHVQLLEYGICPKCKATRSQLYLDGKLDVPNEFCGLAGQRTGKSALTSMTSSYLIHCFLKVPNLAQTYKLLPTSPFTCPFVALSFEKARENLYNAIFGYLTTGKWFQTYHDFLKEQQSRLDYEVFQVKDTFTRYRHKNILIIPLGPDKRKLRGNTSLIGAVDELSWMISSGKDNIKFDADEIYTSLNNSFMTARASALNLLKEGYSNMPMPMLFNISSPSSKKDKMCRLYEDSKTTRSMYGVHLATWELNPNLPFESEDMQKELKKNAKNFWRDFGAVPPNSANPFMGSIDLVKSCCSGRPNIAKIRKLTSAIDLQDYSHGELVIPQQEVGKIPNRILAMDAGVVNNSFAFALAHLEEISDNNPLVPVKKIVVFDSLMEIIPNDNSPLNYSKIFDCVIIPAIKKLNVKLVCTDRWQNLKILSDIANGRETRNCKTEQYSVKYNNFIEYKQAFLDHTIKIPKPELNWDKIEAQGGFDYPYCFQDLPVSHYVFQCLTVEDKAGKTVDKGEGGLTDDIFRASVLAYVKLLDPKYNKLFSGYNVNSAISSTVGMRATMSSTGNLRSSVGAFVGTGRR